MALSQSRQKIHFDAELARMKQQDAEAKQHEEQRATTWDQLDKLECYLRRALCRRNKAIRAFDAIVTAAAERSANPHPI